LVLDGRWKKTRMRLTSIVATALLALASLTGCGSSDDAAATAPLTSSPTPSVSESPSDSASASTAADPAAITTSYPEIGLVFDDLPHVTGAKQAALKAWTELEAAVTRSTVSDTFDPTVERLGNAELAQGVRNNIAYLKKHHQHYAGTMHDRFTKLLGASDRIVVFDVCYDGTDAWLEATDGTGKREPLHPEVGAGRVQVTNVTGLWKVTSLEYTEKSC
jgi:hypothetical protein